MSRINHDELKEGSDAYFFLSQILTFHSDILFTYDKMLEAKAYCLKKTKGYIRFFVTFS